MNFHDIVVNLIYNATPCHKKGKNMRLMNERNVLVKDHDMKQGGACTWES